MEALWTRFNPVFDQLLTWISEGQIGKIKCIYASFSFNGTNRPNDSRLFNLEKGGGSLLDIGIYPLFLSYQLLGYPNTIISNAIKSDTGVDNQMAIILRYKDSQALLYSSFYIMRICLQKFVEKREKFMLIQDGMSQKP